MKYFTIEELCASATARRKKIDNAPTEEVRRRLELLTEKVLDPLREAYGAPIIVTSGYRSERLNRAIGGVANSQHQLGEAADIVASRGDNRRLFELVTELRLPYDQLIDEYGYQWVHVSYTVRHANRFMILHTK